jgi:putative transcriptional regulator
MKKKRPSPPKKARSRAAGPHIDWTRFDAMTPEERRAAAMRDPDARPLAPQDLKRMPRVPQVKVIRRALDLSQEEFAAHFRIPITMLRDWEDGHKEPDAAAKAYLQVIAKEPDVVRRALKPRQRIAA